MKCLSVCLLALCLAIPALAQPSKPNVIVFLVDDMGWMDSGVYGSKYYETPNMDRFATRAMRFTQAYAQPLCSPTRCSLLTGQYTARHGITSATGHQPPQPAGHAFRPASAPATQPMLLPESKNYMEPSQYTLAEALHDAGYRTAHIGKWHLGTTPPHWPEKQGFDVAFHCHPDPGPPGSYFSPYGVTAEGNPTAKTKVGTITDGPAGEYIVDRQADEAVKFIEGTQGKPFFLNLWCYGVHGPWGHKEAYTQLFAAKKDPRGVQGNPIMASMLRSVDECFGRIVDSLDRLGIRDNTIVIFTSDNGGNAHSNTGEGAKEQRKASKKGDEDPALKDWRKWAGHQPPTINTPLREGKGTLYEGGTRVPLMWSWPGQIKPGSTSDALVGPIDLYPTVLDLLGLQRRESQVIDGVSYASVLKQTGPLERKAYFNYHPHAGSAGKAGGVWVRSGDWKLLRWFGAPAGSAERYELYNLADDLSETKNLASSQPDRVKELDALIDGFLTSTGALYPLPNPAYKPTPAASAKRPAAHAGDPLEGWKPRQCEAVRSDGKLVVKGKANAFLGYAMGRINGPATLRARLKVSVPGEAKVEWLPKGAADPTLAKYVPFKVAAGDWQEITASLDEQGPLGTVRLYLPGGQAPVEVDWIEVVPAQGKGQRWSFDEAP